MPSDLTETSIRSEINRYLNGRKSLDEFYASLIPATWDIDTSAPKSMRDLVNSIKLYLAEYSRGHRTEKGLRQQLRAMVRKKTRTKC